jgi:hypothetical protein
MEESYAGKSGTDEFHYHTEQLSHHTGLYYQPLPLPHHDTPNQSDQSNYRGGRVSYKSMNGAEVDRVLEV